MFEQSLKRRAFKAKAGKFKGLEVGACITVQKGYSVWGRGSEERFGELLEEHCKKLIFYMKQGDIEEFIKRSTVINFMFGKNLWQMWIKSTWEDGQGEEAGRSKKTI